MLPTQWQATQEKDVKGHIEEIKENGQQTHKQILIIISNRENANESIL